MKACVHVGACALECRCSPRLEEGIGSLIDGDISSCELPGEWGDLTLDPLEEHY